MPHLRKSSPLFAPQLLPGYASCTGASEIVEPSRSYLVVEKIFEAKKRFPQHLSPRACVAGSATPSHTPCLVPAHISAKMISRLVVAALLCGTSLHSRQPRPLVPQPLLCAGTSRAKQFRSHPMISLQASRLLPDFSATNSR
jgi:hypothetical protein